MNNLVLTLVGACAVTGLLRVQWGRLRRNALLSIVIGALVLAGARVFFSIALDNAYHKDKIIAGMQLLHHKVAATVYRTPPEEAATP